MNFIIVVVMATITPNNSYDFYAFASQPFATEVMCQTFAKQNYDLINTIASAQYDGAPTESIWCLDENTLYHMMGGTV